MCRPLPVPRCRPPFPAPPLSPNLQQSCWSGDERQRSSHTTLVERLHLQSSTRVAPKKCRNSTRIVPVSCTLAPIHCYTAEAGASFLAVTSLAAIRIRASMSRLDWLQLTVPGTALGSGSYKQYRNKRDFGAL